MIDTHRYPAQVFWSDEDQGFIALASDLPGCSSFGSTQDEAIHELQHAISAWIEAAEKAGNPVPCPSCPADDYSGKLALRMAKSLHRKLAECARVEGVSLNQHINNLLIEAHTGRAVVVQSNKAWAAAIGNFRNINQTQCIGGLLDFGTPIQNSPSPWVMEQFHLSTPAREVRPIVVINPSNRQRA